MKTLLLLSSLALLGPSLIYAAPNTKPFVIPELRDWTGQEGQWKLTDKTVITVPAKDQAALQSIAKNFAADIQTMFGKNVPVRVGQPGPGDIVLSLGKLSSKNKEAYALDMSSAVTATGNTPTGVFWATRTLLQLLEQSPDLELPKGKTLDYPKYPVRGFMLDCGRKFFTIDYLRDYVKFLAYYKMNTFQVHLNDNGFKQFFGHDWNKTYAAFRLECKTYPGLTAKDGSYSKKEFIDLQKLAERNGVNIIPEIDAPAHSLAFSRYMPEIGSKEYGMDHLDIMNPKTYTFMDGLFKEYLSGPNPVFRGKQVHIGTDEYSNAKKDVVEKFRAYTDHYIRLVEKYGKQAVVWGALTHAKGDTPVKAKNVIMNAWYNGYADPKEMVKQGYELISMPDGLLYIVPEAGYYSNYLNTQHLYNSWEPTQVGNVKFDDGDPKIKGGMFAVWNDHPGNGISEKDVHDRVFPAMQTLSAKMWTGGGNLIPFEQFEQLRQNISEAPGVNIMGRVKGAKGIVLQKETLAPGEATGMKEIGYGYKVDFTLKADQNPKGTVLFSSPNATVYLSDPKDGKLGFARDGYLFTFDYTVPAGKEVKLGIAGDNKATRLYVDGELKETLDIQKVIHNDNPKDVMFSVRTLVFPLEKAGNFKGEMKNLTVTVQ